MSGWLIQSLSNPLCIRFPMLRPGESGWIGRFIAHALWNPIAFVLMLASLTLVTLLITGRVFTKPNVSFEDISRIQGDRLILLGLVYIVIKALHELGHYLACVRWKVRCREVGFMLLVFAPSLYCDTTDSWRLSSKWQRAAIAAGGIYVELIIATLAGVVYLSSGDGLLNTIAAQTILVCGISTIIVNGNPFFRYDGYYIASDLWGVPNLAPQSQQAIWQSFIRVLGGRVPMAKNFDRPIWALNLFAIASMCYRGGIFVAILAILWKLLVPMGLGLVALVIIATLFIGLFFYFKRLTRDVFLELFMDQPIRPTRVFAFILILLGSVWAAYKVPIPLTIRSRCFLDYETRKALYCRDASVLNHIGPVERELEASELIFSFDSMNKKKEILDLENELSVLDVKIEVLRKSMVDEAAAAFELPALQELRKEWESRLSLLRREAMTLREEASTRGKVYPTRTPLSLPLGSGRETKSLSSLLDNVNLGGHVAQGTLLGWFVPVSSDNSHSSRLVAHAAVSETDLRWLKIGMKVFLQCDALPGTKIPATIKRIATESLDVTPPELVGDFGIVSLRDTEGRLNFEEPHYQVIVEANKPISQLNRGTLATAEFSYRELTLAQWAREKVRQAFQHKNEL